MNWQKNYLKDFTDIVVRFDKFSLTGLSSEMFTVFRYTFSVALEWYKKNHSVSKFVWQRKRKVRPLWAPFKNNLFFPSPIAIRIKKIMVLSQKQTHSRCMCVKKWNDRPLWAPFKNNISFFSNQLKCKKKPQQIHSKCIRWVLAIKKSVRLKLVSQSQQRFRFSNSIAHFNFLVRKTIAAYLIL